jgi:hypothetical protein
MNKFFVVLLISFIFSSCSQQKRINYHIKSLKSLGVVFNDSTSSSIRIDTFIKLDTLNLYIDTTIYEILKEDTCINRKTIGKILPYIKIPPYYYSDSLHKLHITIENGQIVVDLELLNRTITQNNTQIISIPTPEPKKESWLQRTYSKIKDILLVLLTVLVPILLLLLLIRR